MGRKGVSRGTVDAVHFRHKAGFQTAVHLVITGILEPFQLKSDRGKRAETAYTAAVIFQCDRPHLMEAGLRHIDTPFAPDTVFDRLHLRIADVVGALVLGHLSIERALANVPADVAVLIAQIQVAGIVVVDHAHIRFLVEIIAAAMPDLGNLGTETALVPQIVEPIPRRPGVGDHTAVAAVGKLIHRFAHFASPCFTVHRAIIVSRCATAFSMSVWVTRPCS